MSIYRLKLARLERVTRAIGYVCVVWASEVRLWIPQAMLLTPLDNERISHIVTADTDIRVKIKKPRAIAFVRKAGR